MTTKWKDFRRQTPVAVVHRAPAGQFRVMACDMLEDSFADYLVGDFDELDAAIAAANGAHQPMTAVYVYDDTGQLKFDG
jgi:hypothetical protein